MLVLIVKYQVGLICSDICSVVIDTGTSWYFSEIPVDTVEYAGNVLHHDMYGKYSRVVIRGDAHAFTRCDGLRGSGLLVGVRYSQSMARKWQVLANGVYTQNMARLCHDVCTRRV